LKGFKLQEIENMKILVEKFGGTSVGSIDRIKAIAQKAVAAQESGYQEVVVVSAMGSTTDDLLAMAGQITTKPRHRELGMLLSTGEVISCSLVAMAIQALGKKATSLTGSQCGIIANGIHTDAKIENIDTTYLKKLLAQDEIVVVAGYQGKSGDDIAVLGRGGSDASAVALAAALEAESCNIYTDVQGVFTADPRIVKNTSLLHGISYEEMIELAASGAQVMMGRAVEIARKYGLKINVSSSFEDSRGTIITKEECLEKVVITGVAANKNVAIIDIFGIKIGSDVTAKILNRIAEQQINIILMNSNSAGDGVSNLSIVIKPEHVEEIIEALNYFASRSSIDHFQVKKDVAQVSIVGSGIANHYGVAFEMFDTLSKNGIAVLMTSTSEIKITALIPRKKADLAVIKLHEKFKLNHLQRNFVEKNTKSNG
jgi:aspartate kinase